MKILIIGFNTRHIACSAQRAGHTVYSLSGFGDVDLKACVHGLIVKDMKHHPVPIGADIMSLMPLDCVVLGPGFELYHNSVAEITGNSAVLLNNPFQIMANVSDKLWLSRELTLMGLPHPRTAPLSDCVEWDIYPAIIKPRYGAGGMGTVLIEDRTALLELLDAGRGHTDEFILQEYMDGIVVSVSLISTGKEARAISVNENLTGWPTSAPFAYCGSITPFISEHNDLMCRMTVDLAAKLNLVGSNGVDFIITDRGPIILEVNPRFQGSIDTVESSTGINVFRSHLDSFNGILPEPSSYMSYSIRVIFFAPLKFIVGKNIYDFLSYCLMQGMAADVPPEGTICEKYEPVVSFISSGSSRKETIEKVKDLFDHLMDILIAED